MRKNYTYIPKMPKNRNAFIDCIKEKTEVIVICNDMIDILSEEINKNIGKGKAKATLTTVGVAALLVFNLYNPLTWIFGLGSLATSGMLRNEVRKYNVHMGRDVNNKEIIVLIRKNKVNAKLDTIAYDKKYVLMVESKEYRGHIKQEPLLENRETLVE